MTIPEIELVLRKLGYINFKNKTANRIAILADGDRSAVLRRVAEIFKDKGAFYNPSYQTPLVNGKGGNQVSSLGVVQIGDKIVFTRPASRQGSKSAGIGKEIAFVNGINKYLDTGYGAFHTITVVFSGSGRTVVVDNVLIAEASGSDTAGRKKSDVNLLRLNAPTFRVSLKKSTAEFWESADTIYGSQAVSILETLEEQGEIQIKRIGNKVDFGFGISGIAIPTTDYEKTNFVFGSDILGNGAIVKQTFSGDSHFTWDENNLILKVNCVKLYNNLQQIKSSSEDPYILIRKDSSRTAGLAGRKDFAGLRVQAVYKSRLTGNVKLFPRSKFVGLI
jgi:hypothetical protein